MGRYEQSLALASKALALIDEGQLPNDATDFGVEPFSSAPYLRVRLLVDVARDQGQLGRPEEQERALRAALVAAADIPFWSFLRPGWRALVQEELAEVLREHGRTDEAVALALDALGTRRAIMRASVAVALTYPDTTRNARELFLRSTTNAVETLLAAGQRAAATANLETGLALARGHGFRAHEGRLLAVLARVRHESGAHAEAAALREQALANERAVDPDGPRFVELYTDLGVVRRAQDRRDDAMAALREAIRRHEDFRAAFTSARSRNAVLERRLRAYYLAALAAMDRGDQEAAFELAERARARGFLDLLAHRASLAREGRPELLAEERALRAAQMTALREFGAPFFWAAYQLTGDGG